LPHLESKYQLSDPSANFLKFWHIVHCCEAAEGDNFYFHLFHGHVFALHPTSSEFLRTATGRESIGDWLVHPDHASAFGRLLHGLYVAAGHYNLRRDDRAQERKKQPDCLGNALDELEEPSTD
jgi:hypothetical protein